MDLASKLTIVIPTYNRPLFVKKSLAWYAAMASPPRIVVADSSEPANEAMNRAAIGDAAARSLKAVHALCGDVRPIQALSRAAPQIETPYVAFMGDDDYPLERYLVQFAAWLDSHEDYHAAMATIVRVELEMKGSSLIPLRISRPVMWVRSIEDESAYGRLRQTFHPYMQINTFALQRSGPFQRMAQQAEQYGFENNPVTNSLVEAFQVGYTGIQGKLKTFPGCHLFMGVLEAVKNTPNRELIMKSKPLLADRLNNDDWLKAGRSIVQGWAAELSRVDGSHHEAALSQALECWQGWFQHYYPNRQLRRPLFERVRTRVGIWRGGGIIDKRAMQRIEAGAEFQKLRAILK